ncbi:MAG: hypothetical protein WC603_01845 [Candidatus Paceibacterota bacterium]|jgi:hypothetical protein
MGEKFKNFVHKVQETVGKGVEKAKNASALYALLISLGFFSVAQEVMSQEAQMTPEKLIKLKEYVRDNVSNGIGNFGQTYTHAVNNNEVKVYKWNNNEIVQNQAGDLMLINTKENPDGTKTTMLLVDEYDESNDGDENAKFEIGDVDQFDVITVNPDQDQNPSPFPEQESIDEYIKYFGEQNFTADNVDNETVTIPDMPDLKLVSTKDLPPEQQQVLDATLMGSMIELVQEFNGKRAEKDPEMGPRLERELNSLYK